MAISPSAKLDVAVASDMCVDLVLRGNVRPQFHQVEQLIDDYCLELGGSANIFAAQMAKLGARAGVIGFVGNDAFGSFILDRLRDAGGGASLVQQRESVGTELGVALAEAEDRAILTYLGTIDAADLDLQNGLESYAGPGHWNDPDMLEVGNGGMSTTEYRAHFGLWCLLAAPLMAGNDIRNMNDEIHYILTKKEVIAVDQDPLGMEGRRVRREGDLEVWAKQMSDGSRAVVLLNRGGAEQAWAGIVDGHRLPQ